MGHKGQGTRRTVRARFWLGSLTALSFLTSPVMACIQANELQADQIRFIDLQLKVAALQCRQSMEMFPALYNGFATTHHRLIDDSRPQLEAFLTRQSGGDIDSYFTRLANRVALEAISMRDFCSLAAAAAVASAKGARPQDSIDLMPVRYVAPMEVCSERNSVTVAQGTITALPSQGTIRRQ